MKKADLAGFEAVLDASGVAGMLEASMPRGGRPRQLPVRTVLLGALLALADGRPGQLAFFHRALVSLPSWDKVRLKVSTGRGRDAKDCTYRQYSDTFLDMCAVLDPSPVPSFRADKPRVEALAAARRDVDASKARKLLDNVTDLLLEASVPERYKHASKSLAVDWTDHETWSRPRDKDDPEPANDADASWGHATRNAPGAVELLFFGYYAQAATMVNDLGGEPVPELVRRIAFASPATDPARVMATTLGRLAGSGVALGDTLCDCGYSNRTAENWASPLRRSGAQPVMDLHPNDRSMQGTFEGAVLALGQIYCPAVPKPLTEVTALKRGATRTETQRHDARVKELSRYKFAPLSSEDAGGQRRVMCPAAAEKLRCPLKEASLRLSADRPTVASPPASPPRCCTQASITVSPDVNAKTRQRHDFASPEHRASYNRRTAAERTFASMADRSSAGVCRGWCRMFGVAKNTIVYALAVVARNARIVRSFERRQAEAARRAERHKRPRRRRRETAPEGRPNEPEPSARSS